MIFGFGYIAITVSGNTNSEPADMESIEIICNDYLIEGEKLEISYNLYPENSRDRVLVYVICDGIKEPVDISSGYLSYDYNKYNKKDFEVVIESRYNDVTAKKEITFISSDVIMIVVDNGEESGILKYYLREEEKFEYNEIDALKSKELYEKVFANSLWYYPDLKDSTYYFSEGLMTDKAELYLIKDYKIQVIDVNYPSFIKGKLKLTIGLLKADSYEDIDALALPVLRHRMKINYNAINDRLTVEDVIKEHPVMLNRAPTLHRLGIQAFEPKLISGKAIRLHPLVTTGFNADFDGDQMAVHVPLSPEAQAEARYLMLSVNNLLKPQDGKPVTVPTQDMILGSYYLTMETENEKGEGMYFKDEDEALLAYYNGDLGLHAKVKIRRTKQIGDELKTKTIETTVGRIIYNAEIPQDLGFVDRTDPEKAFDLEIDFPVMKKNLGTIIAKCIDKHGLNVAAELLDYIKALGFKYSTRGAITVSVADVAVPEAKKEILANSEKQVDEIGKQFKRGLITEDERYASIIKVWEKATSDVTDAMKDNFDDLNPIYMMAQSGARGNMNQLRQIAGMRGLMANTSGKAVEIPIKSCFREGLDVLEYFISSHGARKGLADTALRTADSGYLTRRLVDVSQDIIVRETDCGSTEGIEIEDIKDGNQIIEKLHERLVGRYALHDIVDPTTNEVIVDTNTLISSDIADKVIAAGITKVEVRSVLGCKCKHGVCAKCYGMGLATRKEVNIGEAVGIIAAQSIGEPGTQLTMRTFHTGGVAGGDITQGLPRVEELFEARKPKGLAVISEIDGTVKIQDVKKRKEITVTSKEDSKTYTISFGSKLKVKEGDEIKAGDPLTEGSINPNEILAIKGAEGVYKYLTAEVQKVYRNQGVDINDKHIEVIGRQMLKKVKVEDVGDTTLVAGSLMDVNEFNEENEKVKAEGKTAAKGKRLLLGITKASLATDSFLSAASFQETTRVLTEAAIKGKKDELIGLKENVIIGKLIPAGTGMNAYRNIRISTEEEQKLEENAEVVNEKIVDSETAQNNAVEKRVDEKEQETEKIAHNQNASQEDDFFAFYSGIAEEIAGYQEEEWQEQELAEWLLENDFKNDTK